MNNQDLIPELQASQLAGVSATTLARFVEAGYLRTQNDLEGSKKYSKSEICKLFAIDSENPAEDPYLTDAVEMINPEETLAELSLSTEEPREEKIYWANTVSPDAALQNTNTHSGQNGNDSLQAEKIRLIEDSYKDKTEITRLRNITMMQDKVLELRENEIDELRKEKEWLRTRIEKLEEKSERDQMLLLAETQTIKKLISISQEKKPSTFRAALEWLGLVPQNQSKSIQISTNKTIE